jgi:hypothetical protein
MFFFSCLIRERGKGFAFQILVKMAGLLLAHEALVKHRVGGVNSAVDLRQRLLCLKKEKVQSHLHLHLHLDLDLHFLLRRTHTHTLL